MEEACRRVALPGTQVDGVDPGVSPTLSIPVVLSWTDESITAVEVLKIINKKANDYDGIIIACFSDPGLDAARELFDIPILGIGETSYYIACMLGHKFSALTSTRKWSPPKERRVRALGIDSKLASIRPYSETFSEDQDKDAGKKLLLAAAKKAVDEDGAEVVIIGHGPYAGITKEIESEVGVPVVDPVTVTLKVMEALIDLGLKPSKKGIWANPVDEASGTSYRRPI